MKSIFSISFIAVAILLITACNNDGSKREEKPTATEANSTEPAAVGQDSIAITKLVKELYKWEEQRDHVSDYEPKEVAGDSLYRGIDWAAYEKRTKTLKETNFFDQRFLDNHKQIAQYLDTALKSGRELWPKDELPSFNYDVSPWCSCQVAPFENYWDSIKVVNLKIEDGHADFAWTWGERFMYETKATKENGTWKISYLFGFDPENFRSNP